MARLELKAVEIQQAYQFVTICARSLKMCRGSTPAGN